MTTPFGARLRAAVSARGPLCAGLDPHASLLVSWGLTDDISGLETFSRIVVDALADRVAVLKPQSAFFERHGSAGIAVLEESVARARAAGALVLLDAKRGDIGSTMAAYAAYLDPGHPMAVDAMTVSPYLGFGSLVPAIEAAQAHGGGLFVLARTSNAEGRQIQLASSGAESVGQQVIDSAAELNAPYAPDGSFGVVVGATLAELDVDLSRLGGPILAPGLGAQGADAAGIERLFGDHPGVVLPSTSRDLLQHGPDVSALRDAAEVIQAELTGGQG